MAGPNMEVFRFGFYLFFPIFAMYKFGDPAWFDTYVQPYKDYLLPPLEGSNKPPKTAAGLHEELSRLKAARKAKSGSADGTLSVIPADHSSIPEPTISAPVPPAPSRTLEALAMDQAGRRDQAVGSSAGVAGQGSRWGWNTSEGSGRLV